MTPTDDWEQLRWVCVELDNGAAVHLCVRRTHTRTHTYTGTQTHKRISNSGILRPDPLGPSQKKNLNKDLVVSGGSPHGSGSYLNRPHFPDNHVVPDHHLSRQPFGHNN